MSRSRLEHLVNPASVAVVGASRDTTKVGHALLANLVRGGYAGQIVPINPKADEILGLACYPDLRSFDGSVELAIIAVPVRFVEEKVREALARGVKAIVVITAGFKEVGEEGAAAERRIAELCARARVPLMGPNCVGLVNSHLPMNASFAPETPPAGGISVISQSGALCVAILDWAASRQIGLGKVFSFGNKADVDEVDLLRYLGDDEETRVVVGYLESIDEGDKFLTAAEEVANVKPVVILKVGVTGAGARAASSHTGSLAGTDMAYGAAFKRSGVIRAPTFDALFDFGMAFAMQPVPKGKRVAVITNAGGPGIMAADAAEERGLELTRPAPSTEAELKRILPREAAFGNPIDVIGDAPPERYLAAFRVIQACPENDAVVVLATAQNMTRPLELADGLVEACDGSKPVTVAFLGGEEVMAARRMLAVRGVPSYPSPERAVGALKAMVDYAAWRERPPRVVTRFPVNRRRVERVIKWHRRSGRRQIGEVEAKEILRAYDFDILEGGLVETADQAVSVAERVGYPVVLKIVSPDIIHKSDVGGVRLRLADAEQVRDAYDLMMLRAARRMPQATIRGAYIERMGRRGREVILGMTRDPQFGPMLMFGLGGIFVEVMKDVTFHLAPITADEAMQMLRGTRSYALLEGARGQAPVDLEGLAGGLQRISQLATEYPEIAELDINPLIVGARGEGAYVADARMTLSTPESGQ